jgi:hypothetical protein
MVGGVLSAQEIKVTTTGADYVFADGYALRPLAEVEAFVTRERHLPGVMSAKEMAESGLPVSQVVTVQLAKIEELTLYAIAAERQRQRMEERAAALDKRNAVLEASLAALNARLERLEAAAPTH